MKWVIQRVSEASVTIDGELHAAIGKGYLILVGIGNSDTKEKADKFIRKMIHLRIFEDENGKTNKSLADVDGSKSVNIKDATYIQKYCAALDGTANVGKKYGG